MRLQAEAEAVSARCPELTLRAESAHQEAFVKVGTNGQLCGRKTYSGFAVPFTGQLRG